MAETENTYKDKIDKAVYARKFKDDYTVLSERDETADAIVSAVSPGIFSGPAVPLEVGVIAGVASAMGTSFLEDSDKDALILGMCEIYDEARYIKAHPDDLRVWGELRNEGDAWGLYPLIDNNRDILERLHINSGDIEDKLTEIGIDPDEVDGQVLKLYELLAKAVDQRRGDPELEKLIRSIMGDDQVMQNLILKGWNEIDADLSETILPRIEWEHYLREGEKIR